MLMACIVLLRLGRMMSLLFPQGLYWAGFLLPLDLYRAAGFFLYGRRFFSLWQQVYFYMAAGFFLYGRRMTFIRKKGFLFKIGGGGV